MKLKINNNNKKENNHGIDRVLKEMESKQGERK